MDDIYQYTFTRTKVSDVTVTIRGPQDSLGIAQALIQPDTREDEALAVLLMDTKNHVIGTEIVGTGGTNSVVVRVAQLFRAAVRLNAVSIILVHNHPSGDPTPSPDDLHLTAECIAAGRLLDIAVLDHIVLGADGAYTSLRDRGVTFAR